MSQSSLDDSKQLDNSIIVDFPELVQRDDLRQKFLNTTLSVSVFDKPGELVANDNGIATRIIESYTKEQNFMKHTVYLLKGFDGQGAIQVTRRYSDFERTRETMLIRWPGCFIPSLPSKRLIQNMEQEFIRERRAGLDMFLQKIAELPFLYYSKEYQAFLRYNGSDYAHHITEMRKISYQEIVERYSQTFAHLATIPYTNEFEITITRFKTFLMRIEGKMKEMKALSNQVVNAKKMFYNGMAIFQTQIALEYEKNVIGEYEEHKNSETVFYQPNNTTMENKAAKMKEAAKNLSLENFDRWISSEIREQQAIMDAIKQKERYERLIYKTQEKINSYKAEMESIQRGEFNLKGLLRLKNQQDNTNLLKQKIEQGNRDITHLKALQGMILMILAHDEIKKFQAKKPEKFYKLVTTVADGELNNLYSLADYWTTVKTNQDVQDVHAPEPTESILKKL